MKNKRINATADYNRYMRNWMRVRHGYSARLETNSSRFAEFERIVLAGRYGSISDVSRRVGVTPMTGCAWLRKITAKAKAGKAESCA